MQSNAEHMTFGGQTQPLLQFHFADMREMTDTAFMYVFIFNVLGDDLYLPRAGSSAKIKALNYSGSWSKWPKWLRRIMLLLSPRL